MKTSFITTVLNEADTIGPLLASLLGQSRLADEIIIVDAGSQDKTVSLVKKYAGVKVIVKPGLNRSQARNLGIKSARQPIIVSSDGGCVLDKNWLENIVKPLANLKVDSVAGYYQVTSHSALSQAITPFVAVMPDQFKPESYLPSSRSIAFRKTAWQKVGGYPENLDYCEDLIFAQKLKAKTRMAVASDALVYWQAINNLTEFFNKIKDYACGDVQAGYWPHIRKILSVFIRYVIFFFFPLLFIAYLIWPILKFNRYMTKPLAVLLLPLIQVTCDLAILRGALAGLKLRLNNLM